MAVNDAWFVWLIAGPPPCVVVNFTRYNSGATAFSAAGFIRGLGRAAPDFVAVPDFVAAPDLAAAPAAGAALAADLAGGGVCARSAAPETANISSAFISAHFTMG